MMVGQGKQHHTACALTAITHTVHMTDRLPAHLPLNFKRNISCWLPEIQEHVLAIGSNTRMDGLACDQRKEQA